MDAEVRRLNNTLNRNKKNSGSSNQAIIELGRGFADFKAGGGLQDASRGFLALANNMERFAETAAFTYKQSGSLSGVFKSLGKSILGPAGLVFAFTALLNYGPEIYKFFKEWITGAKGTSKAIEELNEKLDAGTISVEEYLAQLQADGRERIDQLNKEIELTKRKIAGTALSLRSEERNRTILAELIATRDELLTQDNLYIDGLQNQAEATAKAAEAARKYKQRLAELKDQEDIKPFASELGLNFEDPGLHDVFDIQGADFNIVDVDDVEVLSEYADGLEEIDTLLTQLGSKYAGLSIAQSEFLMKANEDFEKAKVGVNDFSQALIGGFEAAAARGGNILENLARGILQSIGSLLIKEGSAYIALGIARNSVIPGWGTPAIKNGALAVAAGVALKAGGSAIGSGGGGGRDTSPGARSNRPRAASATPTANQGQGIIIRGQDLRYIGQAADDSYVGLN